MKMGIENESVEFKKSTSELKEGIISLSSMLNKNNHGELYFGIKDDGSVVGQQIGDRTLREISQAIANYIKPQIIPTITLELIDEQNVIHILVEGSDTPYSAFGKYYMRSSDEDRELSPNQLRALMQRKEESDEIVLKEASNQNLEFNQLKSLLIGRNLSVNDETFKDNFSLVTKDGKYNLMAELLSDKNDVSIKVVAFNGTDKTEVIRRNEYGFKCLALAMDQVLTYVEALNDTKIEIGSHQRKEEKLFDFACFKEAWQNACIHNKWIKNNPPAVYIFSDRIEIVSTGGIPSDMDKEEFFKGISKPINAKLQKIFGQLGYVEQTGHGVPLIVNKYGTQVFDLMNNFINVTIPFNKNMIKKMNTNNMGASLNQNQERLLINLRDNPSSTINDLVKILELSDGYVRKMLSYLKENNYIERVGSNKTGYWKVDVYKKTFF